MLKNSGIAAKLIFFICLSGALILTALLMYNYFVTRNIVMKDLRRNAKNLACSTVNKIEAVLNPIEKVPESLAHFLEFSEYDRKELLDYLKAVVSNNPEIYGAAIAFEPHAFIEDSLYFSPYYCKDADSVKLTYLGGESYQYFYWDWYQVPKKLQKPIWSEPYYDEGGGEIVMSTYSVPFYHWVNGERKFYGIVTADISIDWLQDLVRSIHIYKSGYGFLISHNGTFLTYPPDENLIMNETIFTLAESINDKDLREIGNSMLKGDSGFVQTSALTKGQGSWLYYAPLPSSGWSLGVLFPEKELMADIYRLSAILIILGIAGLVLLSITVALISTGITKPLRALVKAASTAAEGDLDFALPPARCRDEAGKLSDAFNYMISSLKDYIQKLTETTAAKERIESELNVAHNIQMSIIPRMFPPFPEREEFDLHAVLKPARQVGGDYYDFFFLDDDHLCFTIGDVSGKGVPASLYMAITRTLIRAKSGHGLSPALMMTRVNQDLCVDNDSSMFVTIFLGILDARTGGLEFCNGGHDLPFIISAEGKIGALGESDGLIVGIIPDYEYNNRNITLKAGDAIFLFTDGVTEAMNAEEDMFSRERLEEVLGEIKSDNPADYSQMVLKAVEKFAGDNPQSDDITLLTLVYYGRGGETAEE
ncbi:SpoIIE family protein phosphatase [bacterium]|nr:SpoIIE family protein phosphatase [bacterium]